MAKNNLVQTSLSFVSRSYTSQLYRNAQGNQDMKVSFLESTKKCIPKNWIFKLELKLPKREKNMNSLENKLQ